MAERPDSPSNRRPCRDLLHHPGSRHCHTIENAAGCAVIPAGRPQWELRLQACPTQKGYQTNQRESSEPVALITRAMPLFQNTHDRSAQSQNGLTQRLVASAQCQVRHPLHVARQCHLFVKDAFSPDGAWPWFLQNLCHHRYQRNPEPNCSKTARGRVPNQRDGYHSYIVADEDRAPAARSNVIRNNKTGSGIVRALDISRYVRRYSLSPKRPISTNGEKTASLQTIRFGGQTAIGPSWFRTNQFQPECDVPPSRLGSSKVEPLALRGLRRAYP